MKKCIILLIPVVMIASGCLSSDDDDTEEDLIDDISVKDAYYARGYFNFTLVNDDNAAHEVNYKWTLDDPKAGIPVIEGDGEVKLGPNDETVIVNKVYNYTSTVPRYEEWDWIMYDDEGDFLVMNVEIKSGGKFENIYREQKNRREWDYTTLPPYKIQFAPNFTALDSYYDNNGHFNYTIRNNQIETVTVLVVWNVQIDNEKEYTNNYTYEDSPKYDGYHSRVMKGLESRTISSTIENTDVDERYFSLFIRVYCRDEISLQHADYKPPETWDYSTLPPIEI